MTITSRRVWFPLTVAVKRNPLSWTLTVLESPSTWSTPATNGPTDSPTPLQKSLSCNAKLPPPQRSKKYHTMVADFLEKMYKQQENYSTIPILISKCIYKIKNKHSTIVTHSKW
ncbi:hypothetical protein BC943DRAFT_383925, partial [Umbelopsis sp. AD052]